MVLRDEENRVATRTFFVNEARGDKEATVAWRALRGREATCGQAVLWGWELVRDVAPGDEVLTTYEEDASGMPETRPDERSGTADALASIGGVPRNLQGCGYLVATAPRRAGQAVLEANARRLSEDARQVPTLLQSQIKRRDLGAARSFRSFRISAALCPLPRRRGPPPPRGSIDLLEVLKLRPPQCDSRVGDRGGAPHSCMHVRPPDG